MATAPKWFPAWRPTWKKTYQIAVLLLLAAGPLLQLLILMKLSRMQIRGAVPVEIADVGFRVEMPVTVHGDVSLDSFPPIPVAIREITTTDNLDVTLVNEVLRLPLPVEIRK